MSKIIIIGAGASGVMASIILKRKGHDVLVFERNEKPMKKIYATGNGRCNFTNRNIEYKNYHGENKKFVMSAIKNFGYEEAIKFFNGIGIKELELENGKVYPMSLQASSVVKQMNLEAEKLGVKFYYNSYVKRIEFSKKNKVVLYDNVEFEADNIIVATGGRAMEKSGSDGNGYKLLENLGHSIVQTHPGIVQLRLENYDLKKISGTKIPGYIYLIDKNKKTYEQFSDILFTDYGVSGPGVLQISGEVIRGMLSGKEIIISLDLLSYIKEDELFKYLKINFKENGFKYLSEALVGIINDKLIKVIINYLKYEDIAVSNLSKENIFNISKALKDFRVEVTGYKSEKDGQVTCGGISTKEIDPKTMESKIQKNLYIIGEIMDIDGDCGGYNLHWAWASANACANSLN
ncbi:NAD(P)/FAD-dependent oxidoreductase [Miniphocaeibacter massiliensis]|uniref:NAD(P)/FAD-dependent oxidoreductase n=1 Tax=Miniphocaeibacter massiliensis TaxID=2041841 RepID=UPI000C1C334E|nr:NAD(P)/FAD-dependent oxidoreductase [Miniphocaeibacter massiliensis]